MPAAARAAVGGLLRESGLQPPDTTKESMVDIYTVDGRLHIGDVSIPVSLPANPELVPNVVFFEIPSHTLLLRSMLKDFQLKEHLLLMGNQGVGKNKLTDHFVKLMQREREYIQLHRDTTVPTLTINPSLEDGRIVWRDSPLVRSMAIGRILVVDEFDKAPVEVVCVLKALLEDGEILLADGRRFVSRKSVLFDDSVDPLAGDAEAKILRIHPEFRVIALANRPGYPFLGNDFFAEMGDVFACHAIDNPDQASEISLLRAYADDVPATTIRQLTAAMVDLRQLSDDGLIAYPYSTRELVNVVRHMSKYPGDSMNVVLQNVFSFDSYDGGLLRMLHDVFRKHGIPVGRDEDGIDQQQTESELATEHFLPEPILHTTWHDGGDQVEGIPFVEWEVSITALPVVVGKPNDAFGAAAIGQQQILPLGERTSARSNRFAEEVMGWKMHGMTGGYGDSVPFWLTPLPGGSVAAISLSLDIQICDIENDRLQLIPLFPAHPM
jgi:hypothetical protein